MSRNPPQYVADGNPITPAALVLDPRMTNSRGDGPWLYHLRAWVLKMEKNQILAELPPRPRKPRPPLLNKGGEPFSLLSFLVPCVQCVPWLPLPKTKPRITHHQRETRNNQIRPNPSNPSNPRSKKTTAPKKSCNPPRLPIQSPTTSNQGSSFQAVKKLYLISS